MASGVVLWTIASLLLIWQAVLTWMVLRVKEDEIDSAHRLGRVACALSDVVDRFETVGGGPAPSAPPQYYSGPVAYAPPPAPAPAVAAECPQCAAARQAPQPVAAPVTPQAWGRPYEVQPEPTRLSDCQHRRGR